MAYYIFLLNFSGASHRLQEHSVPATQTSVLLNDLQPGTTYLLRVVAENDVGRGESSEPFKLRTEEEGLFIYRIVFCPLLFRYCFLLFENIITQITRNINRSYIPFKKLQYQYMLQIIVIHIRLYHSWFESKNTVVFKTPDSYLLSLSLWTLVAKWLERHYRLQA